MFRKSVSTGERLVAKDPNNAVLLRDYLYSNSLLARALQAQANATEALASYRAALAVAKKLADLDPTNVDRQDDLSVMHDQLASLLVEQATTKAHSPGTASHVRSRTSSRPRIRAMSKRSPAWQRRANASG